MWHCNESIDKRTVEADSMTDPADVEKRFGLWEKFFTDIQNEVPMIPFFHEYRFTMRSNRLYCPDGIFVDPVNIPVHYDQVFIKEGQ